MTKTWVVGGVVAAVAALTPTPSWASTNTTDYRVNAAGSEWSTAPASGHYAPGQVYRDTSITAFKVEITRDGTTKTKSFAYYDLFKYKANENGKLRPVSELYGQARGSNVSITANRLRNLTATAHLKLRKCVYAKRDCTRAGTLDMSAAWAGHGSPYVSSTTFVSHYRGYPTFHDHDQSASRDATVTAQPSGAGALQLSQIWTDHERTSG